jgi:hypothetical protein
MAIVADPDEIRQLDTVTLFGTAIGPDAYRAARAAAEVERRGADEARRAFTSLWPLRPITWTTENFLRDAFHGFGDGFAHHLAGILEDGTQSAVDVAILAFPRSSISPGSPGDRLWGWAEGRRSNPRLGGSRERVSPLMAVGSAALTPYAREIVRRADHVRADVCARALVRMFVQAAQVFEARHVLDALTALVAEAYGQQWPNPQFLLHGHLPAWPLTSAAVDVLVDHALGREQPEEIRIFASDALSHGDARHIAPAVIRSAESGAIAEADAIRTLVALGGPDAALFVHGRTSDRHSLARVLPWLVDTLDGPALDALEDDPHHRWLIARAFGLAGRSAGWIRGLLTSTSFIERGYAGLGLAYALGAEAQPDLTRALVNVEGDGVEPLRERILLETALVHAGAPEHADALLALLPQHPSLRSDLAKRNIIAALASAKGEQHPAVLAWQRVAGVQGIRDV